MALVGFVLEVLQQLGQAGDQQTPEGLNKRQHLLSFQLT